MSDDYRYDLGTYRRPVTTGSEKAQAWFDRGLAWSYGYNHEEAVACYRRALDADPGCAMAWWGVAYAAGPNYNKPWEAFDEEDADTTPSLHPLHHLGCLDCLRGQEAGCGSLGASGGAAPEPRRRTVPPHASSPEDGGPNPRSPS